MAHGSPLEEWNAPVRALEKQVNIKLSEHGENLFRAVRVAFTEFAQPSINTVVIDLEKAGVDKLYALPLFIAPSAHTFCDLPTILGLSSDQRVLKGLKEEGISPVRAHMNITLGPTLDAESVLPDIMPDRVKELSTDPDSEGVVLLAHGDPQFKPFWLSLVSKRKFLFSRGMESPASGSESTLPLTK